jgi:hypothetical protein
MITRLLAWLVTSPVAFLVAGVLDIATAWGRWAASRARARLLGGREPLTGARGQ